MQGLLIRIAKGLNRLWKRKGRVFGDRFHGALKTPREVRNALAYVLNNARKHRISVPEDEPDAFSSGRWFDGWKSFTCPANAKRPHLRRPLLAPSRRLAQTRPHPLVLLSRKLGRA